MVLNYGGRTDIPTDPRRLGLSYDEWRPRQREVLQQIVDSPERVVLLRARTGFGKAAVAQALAAMGDRGALILTKTIQLQEQYGQLGAAIVKGRPNFWCTLKHMSASQSDCTADDCLPFSCEYAKQRWIGETSPFTVTNYAYALRVLRNYGGRFQGRDWIVADEGQHILNAIEDVVVEEEVERVERLKLKYERNDLVLPAELAHPMPPPLWPSRLFNNRVAYYAGRTLVMSATLPSPRVWSVLHDVPENQILFLDEPGTWGDNSRLYFWPVAHMSQSAEPEEGERLVSAVRTIVKHYPNAKGIIHPHSYRMMRFLWYNLHDDPEIGRRLMFAWQDKRQQVVDRFIRMRGSGVLCAASVNEGFDLPYQVGFQIIAKTPWPDLGNSTVFRRKVAFPLWYAQETINSIVQACGRVARAPDDDGETWFLDGSGRRLFQEYPDLWPEWLRRQTKDWIVQERG